jgi:hypothetical protein
LRGERAIQRASLTQAKFVDCQAKSRDKYHGQFAEDVGSVNEHYRALGGRVRERDEAHDAG